MAKNKKQVEIGVMKKISSEDELKELNLNEEMLEQLSIDPETVDETEECVDITLTTGKKEYHLIHAFPGDNPMGIIIEYVDDEPILLCKLGECINEFEPEKDLTPKQEKHAERVFDWYMEMTEDVCHFGEFQKLYQEDIE
jgi:hypothetical protein